MKSRSSEPGPYRESLCPTQWADHMRCDSWGLTITTATQPPIQHQVYYLNGSHSTHLTRHEINNHFTFSITKPARYVGSDVKEHYAAGDIKPFLGHETGTGFNSPQVRPTEKDPVFTKVVHLLALREHVNYTVKVDG